MNLKNLWTHPQRFQVMALAGMAGVTFVALATLVLSGRAAELILDHPSNPGYPTHWHARGYGLFAANPLGDTELNESRPFDFTLPAGQSVTFRYRVLVLSAAPSRDRIERESAAFAQVAATAYK